MVRCSTAEDRVEGTWVDWPLGQVLCQASRCRLPGRGLIKSAILLEHRVHGSIVAQLVLSYGPLVCQKVNLGLHSLQLIRLLSIPYPFCFQLCFGFG